MPGSVLVVCYDTSSGKYLVQSAGSAQIADGAITSGKIASGIVGTVHLRDLNVTSAKLAAAVIASIEADVADESITSAKLASGAVIGDRVAVDAIVSSHIGANVIGGIHILAGAIVSGKLGANVIATPHILNQGILSASIGALAVGTPHLADKNITSAKIAALAIGDAHIASAAAIALSKLDSAVCSETEADGKVSTHDGLASPHAAATTIGGRSIPAEDLLGVVTVVASDTVRNSNDGVKSTTSGVMYKIKEIKLNADLPACRVKFDLRCTVALDRDWQIYKNGAAIGTMQHNAGIGWESTTEDFTDFAKDDLIQIYTGVQAGHVKEARNFRLCYDYTAAISVTNQDP